MKAKSTFSLKDHLFNEAKVAHLANQLAAVTPGFSKESFVRQVVEPFPNLELKQRIRHIANVLRTELPQDYLQALSCLTKSLPTELDPTRTDDDFGDFILAPLSNFVAIFGCERKYLRQSLAALKEMTKRFTAEDAIRYFINGFPNETLKFLERCAGDKNYHVRRLASEGTRPSLPWCQKLNLDYRESLPILNELFADPTRYVTRSVSNHLNDISKKDPQLVIEKLKEWKKSSRQDPAEMEFIIEHSLRTLIKKGEHAAFKMVGFGKRPKIRVFDFKTSTPQVTIGTAFQFSLGIESLQTQKLAVDYIMEFKGRDEKVSRKVFKMKRLDLKRGEEVVLTKRHPMRLMTTRRLYLGKHTIQLQINGQLFDRLSFELVE